MKLTSYNRLGAVVGPILLVITVVFSIGGPVTAGAIFNSLNSERIDLNISDVISLSHNDSMAFTREFGLSEKKEVSLLHVKCRSTENNIKSVFVNVTINGVQTSKTFRDSSTDYSSSYNFLSGAILVVRINSSTPYYILSNTITLEITVDTKSVFNSEEGDFWLDEVIFETFTPPVITADSENTQLPLELSQAVLYVSPLTILKERQFESEVFGQVVEDVRVNIHIGLTPISLPLSSAKFYLITAHSTFESSGSSTGYSINADLIKGDTLYLNFVFRFSTELAEPLVELNLDVTLTGVPVAQNPETSGDLSDFPIPYVSVTFLEAVRFLMILVPLFLFYIRRSDVKIPKEEGTPEKT